MTRRRLPFRRTSSSSPSSSPSSSSSSSHSPNRRNADTRNLVTAHVFGGLEILPFLRAILLGAFVGGLVIFLFYPDISSLLQHWQNSSEQPELANRPAWTEKSGVGSTGTQPRSVDATGKRSVRPQTPNAKNADPAQREKKKKKKPEPAVIKQDRDHHPHHHHHAEEEEDDDVLYSCPCQCQPIHPPQRQPPPVKAEKPKKKPVPKEDLMEEEEEKEETVVEEDPVEVELIEEEEPVKFTDLGSDGNPPSRPVQDEKPDSGVAAEEERKAVKEEGLPSEEAPSNKRREEREVSRDTQPFTPSGTDKEEPLILTDGQPITFTPVSPGDEHLLHIGGRPKTGQGASRDPVGKPQTHTPQGQTEQNASAKSNNAKQPSEKTQSKPVSPKPSQAKQASSSAKKSAGKASKKKERKEKRDAEDLPAEVRNFQPSFLKKVTAKKIFADGRRIPPVELLPQKETNSSVRVFLFNEFLSEAECDGLRRVHDKHVQGMAPTPPLLCFDTLATLRKHLSDVKNDVHVTPNDFVAGTKCLNASFSRQLGSWMGGNWSYSTAFYPGESRFSSVMAGRVQQAMGLAPENGGKFQITSYPTGKAYKAHTDCMLEGGDQRDRVASVLVYLDDVQEGGETKFPELGIWVKPRKGRALVWNNMSPEGRCEPHSLHLASKVHSGSKYILIRWYYYKSFYSLGKRPPEPSLPARAPGTPRVSCDDYDNGSCRWYDEWNNDHLLDYEYNKYTLI